MNFCKIWTTLYTRWIIHSGNVDVSRMICVNKICSKPKCSYTFLSRLKFTVVHKMYNVVRALYYIIYYIVSSNLMCLKCWRNYKLRIRHLFVFDTIQPFKREPDYCIKIFLFTSSFISLPNLPFNFLFCFKHLLYKPYYFNLSTIKLIS